MPNTVATKTAAATITNSPTSACSRLGSITHSSWQQHPGCGPIAWLTSANNPFHAPLLVLARDPETVEAAVAYFSSFHRRCRWPQRSLCRSTPYDLQLE